METQGDPAQRILLHHKIWGSRCSLGVGHLHLARVSEEWRQVDRETGVNPEGRPSGRTPEIQEE